MKIKQVHSNGDQSVDQVEVEGTTLEEMICDFTCMSLDQFEERVRTGSWECGGMWLKEGENYKFESDVVFEIYSL